MTASFLPVATYQITSSWAVSASRAITSSYVTGSIFTSTNPALSASYALTASYAMNGGGSINTSSLATTCSNIFRGNQIITGSLQVTGSNTFIGGQSITGLVNITGSLSQGTNAQAIGSFSHAQGSGTQAIGNISHAEGRGSIASGSWSHAEGNSTTAYGDYSHAEGFNTQAIGAASHAEGELTIASGSAAHAEGYRTIALGNYQHVQGQYNISSSEQSAFIIGNGIDNNKRSNLVFASGSVFQITGSLQVSGSITSDNLWQRWTLTNVPLDVYGQYEIIPRIRDYKFVPMRLYENTQSQPGMQLENNSDSNTVTVNQSIHAGYSIDIDALFRYDGGNIQPNEIQPKFDAIGLPSMLSVDSRPIVITVDGNGSDIYPIDITITGYLKKI